MSDHTVTIVVNVDDTDLRDVMDDTGLTNEAYEELVRALSSLGLSVVDISAQPGQGHHPACVKYGDDSQCNACNR